MGSLAKMIGVKLSEEVTLKLKKEEKEQTKEGSRVKVFQAGGQQMQKSEVGQACIFKALKVGQCGWSTVKERERQGQKVMRIK